VTAAPAKRSQRLRAIKRRAVPLSKAIDAIPGLYAERLALWRECIDLGMKHREIAELFNVETVTVSTTLKRKSE